MEQTKKKQLCWLNIWEHQFQHPSHHTRHQKDRTPCWKPCETAHVHEVCSARSTRPVMWTQYTQRSSKYDRYLQCQTPTESSSSKLVETLSGSDAETPPFPWVTANYKAHLEFSSPVLKPWQSRWQDVGDAEWQASVLRALCSSQFKKKTTKDATHILIHRLLMQ